MATSTIAGGARPDQDELVDAVLASGRALVAFALRSLATVADDVTAAQYRVLIEIAARGPQRLADLASALGVDRSTATRMSDRLARKQLINRRRISSDRRGVRVSLTPAGRELVTAVSRQRHTELSTILQRMTDADTHAVVAALRAFASAAGEMSDRDRSLAWDLVR